MPLDRQTIALPFAGGIDTKTDPKQVQMGKLLELENGVYETPGTIRKRWGSSAATATPVTEPGGLLSYKDELLAVEKRGLMWGVGANQVVSAKGSWGSTFIPAMNIGTLSKQDVVHNADSTCYLYDVARTNGYTLHVWKKFTNNYTYYSLVEDGGSEVKAGYVVSIAYEFAKAVSVGNSLFLIYKSDGHLYRKRFDTTSLDTYYSPAALVTVANSGFFDVAATSTKAYLVYFSDRTHISVTTMSATGAIDTPAAFLGNAGNYCISAFLDYDENCVIAWSEGTDSLRWAAYSPDLAEMKAPTAIAFTGVVANITGGWDTASAGRFTLFVTIASNSPTNPIDLVKYSTTSSAWTHGTVTALLRGSAVCGKAFVNPVSHVLEVPVIHRSTHQATHYLYNFAIRQWSGVWNRGVAASSISNTISAILPNSCVVGSTWTSDFGYSFDPTDSYAVMGVDSYTIDFDDITYSFMSAELGEALLVAGPAMFMYDGKNIVEHGFFKWPEGVTASTGTGTTNVWGYQVVYEWQDATGRVHQSAPSEVVQFQSNATQATDACTLTIPRLQHTNKFGTMAAIYRTEINGSAYYRLGTVAVDVSSATDTVTFTDNNADSVLAGNPVLYNAGGVLENGCAPACLCPTVFANRVWVIDAEDPTTLRYSKKVIAENGGRGSPVEFVDVFLLDVPEEGGSCTALGRLDDKLIVFKRDRVFVVTGAGPDDTGAGDDLTISSIQTSVGCTEPKSVISGPEGLFFHGPIGITKLDRALQSSFVGYDVDGLLAGHVVIGGAVLQDQRQLRFMLDTNAVLVFDYLLNLWSKFTYAGDNLSQVVADGNYFRVDTSGNIYKEDKTLYTDATSFVMMGFRTSWIQLGKISGFQRVRRLLLEGEVLEDSNFYFYIYTDFDSATPVQSVEDISAAAGRYQQRIDLAVQKCEALQIYMYDTEVESYPNSAARFSSLMLEAGVKRGTAKVAATKIA